MKVFISGPMSGIEDFNWPGFYKAEKMLVEKGYSVFNPAWINVDDEWAPKDFVKKHLFQGGPWDTKHLADELGDVAWYLAVSAAAIGYDLEGILKMNLEKLKKRYPERRNLDGTLLEP